MKVQQRFYKTSTSSYLDMIEEQVYSHYESLPE